VIVDAYILKPVDIQHDLRVRLRQDKLNQEAVRLAARHESRRQREIEQERARRLKLKVQRRSARKKVYALGTWFTRYTARCRAKEDHRTYRKRLAKIAGAVRARLHTALRGNKKSAKTAELTGCSFEQLKAHLEKQFRPGMTWDNRGKVWHIDHIKPCAKFDLSLPDAQRACFQYTNLQPLFARENRVKGAKMLTLKQVIALNVRGVR